MSIKGVSYNEVMNLDDFSYVENDRRYVKPEVSLNERNTFIDNLRSSQAQNAAQIRQDTYNLGTAVPSSLGGLGGGSRYFAARYQTPQMNSMIADLRAAAQSQALNDLLQNEISKAKKRYNDAYRAAKKRESAGSSGGNGTDEYLDKMKTLLNANDAGGLQDTNITDEESEEIVEHLNSSSPLYGLTPIWGGNVNTSQKRKEEGGFNILKVM